MRRRPRLVGVLWHWHRRVGVLAAFFVVVLAATGIVLNHSSELGLDRNFIDWPWLTRAYGDNSVDLPAFTVEEHWLSRAANGRVYLDGREVAPCSGRLVGGAAMGDLLYAGCVEELLLITERGELVESVNASTGLPVPLQAIGFMDNRIAVQADGTWWLVDSDMMDFKERAPQGAVIAQNASGRLPDTIQKLIPAANRWLSWERLLLDLHSGRLLGRMGVLWMDTVAVLMATLATSGVAMWFLHRRRNARHTETAKAK